MQLIFISISIPCVIIIIVKISQVSQKNDRNINFCRYTTS